MRPAHRAVDALAVLLLAGLALTGLDNSYSSRAYLVTGMVAVTAITAWGLLCAVQRYAAGMFLLVASLAFPVLGATAALHNIDWLGFPSARSVVDLLSATLTAPGQFLATIPPVDASGPVLAIPYVLGYLGGGTAAGLALWTRRPLLPVVPLVLMLGLCAALGTAQPRALLLRALAFAGLALLWVVLRAARTRSATYAARGRAWRAVAATVVAVGSVLASALLLPHSDASRVVLRGRVGSGQDVSQLDNPLAGFRRFRPQPAGSPDNVAGARLLRVTGLPRGDLLRIEALDVYDGSTWNAGNRTVPGDSESLFQRIGSQVGAPRPGRTVHVGVEVEKAWSSSWLPLAGQLTGISFDYLDGRAQRTDVRYDVATETGLVVGGLEGHDDYHFSAVLPDTTLTAGARAYGEGRPGQPAGAFLDRYLMPWRTSGLTPVRQVLSLARYLRVNGRYSDGGTGAQAAYVPGQSELRLGASFFGARTIVGDDEQYAAFMALAANRLGVPARVVVGARPGRQGVVRGRDVLAWVELRVADGSWRTLATDRFMSHRPPRRTDVRPSPQSYVARTQHHDRAQSLPQAQPPGSRPAATAVAPGRHWGAYAVALLVCLIGLMPALKLLRRTRRRRRAPTGRVVGGWAEVLDLARDLGADVPPGLTRTEQARRAGLSLDLARMVDDVVFARGEPTPAQAAEVWRLVRAERRRLLRSASAVRRVAAVWHPGSLARSVRAAARRRRPAGRRGRGRRAVRLAP